MQVEFTISMRLRLAESKRSVEGTAKPRRPAGISAAEAPWQQPNQKVAPANIHGARSGRIPHLRLVDSERCLPGSHVLPKLALAHTTVKIRPGLRVIPFKQGDLAAAEKWLKEAEKSIPHDARVQYQLGLVYRKQGREEEAKEAIAQSGEQRQRDSSESQLRLECGQKLDQASRAEAHAFCEQLYDPDDAEKLTELGTLYGQHADVEAALKPLRRAAELAPQSPQMQYNLALAYYQLNRFGEARAALSPAVTRWPDIFQLVALYGAVLSKLGEDLLAYETLQHAHELNAQNSATGDLLFLATLSLARKAQSAVQYPDALRYFHEAAKLKPQEPAPHRGLADIYKLTGHPAQAASERRSRAAGQYFR